MGDEPGKKKPRSYKASLDDAGALVLTHDAPLPGVCLKCGAHEDIVRRNVVFSWSPRWVRYLIFCVIGLLLRALTRVKASLVIPLCPRCNARWSAATYATNATIAAIVAAVVAARLLPRASPVGRYGVLAAAVLFAIVYFAFVKPRILDVHRLDEKAIAFKGVNPEAVKEILEGSRSRE